MTTESSAENSKYVVDTENPTELVRLMYHDRLMTRVLGGVCSEQEDISRFHNVLDLACGPGGWVLDMAHALPDAEIVGIDVSTIMIEYAQAQAHSQGLQNARFEIGDILQPLPFADSSFDLVNMRFAAGFMPSGAWPTLLRECSRVLNPDGIIRLTETDVYTITNSSALRELYEYASEAFVRTGKAFMADGKPVGLTAMLGKLLREAGFQHVQHAAHAVEYSAGTEAHDGFYENLMVALKLVQPLLLRLQINTQERLEQLYDRMLIEMMSDDFCAIAYFLTVWGQKQ